MKWMDSLRYPWRSLPARLVRAESMQSHASTGSVGCDSLPTSGEDTLAGWGFGTLCGNRLQSPPWETPSGRLTRVAAWRPECPHASPRSRADFHTAHRIAWSSRNRLYVICSTIPACSRSRSRDMWRWRPARSCEPASSRSLYRRDARWRRTHRSPSRWPNALPWTWLMLFLLPTRPPWPRPVTDLPHRQGGRRSWLVCYTTRHIAYDSCALAQSIAMGVLSWPWSSAASQGPARQQQGSHAVQAVNG